ncbi:hypothetical protein JG688_00009222 [Phytophthora aleatoria]|uniref:Uncharacterized protein n=1 Tax=Phytophthora aleatoria TaxID=2496075 RepID=A0A8J5M2J0_9STRA|nr:hypothetical protein JG688_00009222 [Phytophthora aleatoria]
MHHGANADMVAEDGEGADATADHAVMENAAADMQVTGDDAVENMEVTSSTVVNDVQPSVLVDVDVDSVVEDGVLLAVSKDVAKTVASEAEPVSSENVTDDDFSIDVGGGGPKEKASVTLDLVMLHKSEQATTNVTLTVLSSGVLSKLKTVAMG